MPDRTVIAYRYDGSLEGLFCCVYESYTRREIPTFLYPYSMPQATLFPVREIETDAEHAARVERSWNEKVGADGRHLLDQAFLNGSDDKERCLFEYIRLGFRCGRKTPDMLADPVVSEVQNLARAVGWELQHLLGFLRFSDYGGSLVAVIHPKHVLIPLMRDHFCGRYPEEQFLIFDETHHMALIYKPYESRIFPLESLDLPNAESEEKQYRLMWKQYYESAGVEARKNPRCQMNHMPKRFWKDLTEMSAIGANTVRQIHEGVK